MNLKENMGRFFRAFAEKNQLSLSRLQIMAEVSRGSIYAYSRGEGNPTLSTVECIACNLKVDPAAMILGVYDPGSKEISVLLLNTVRGVAGLTRAERQQFVKLFMQEMIKLWDED